MGCVHGKKISHTESPINSAYIFQTEYASKCNANCELFLIVVRVLVDLNKKNSVGSKNIKIMTDKHKSRPVKEVLGMQFFKSQLRDSQSSGLVNFTEKAEKLIFNGLAKLDVDDEMYYFESEKEANNSAARVFQGIMPSYTTEWKDWSSPKTQSEFIFSGLGQFYLKSFTPPAVSDPTIPSDATFVIDLSAWAKYDVRKGYAKWGTIGYFNAQWMPCGIYWCEKKKLVLPTDSDHAHVSFLFRSNVLINVVLSSHLVDIHWVVSNGLVLASERHLSKAHPLRRLIAPHTYNAVVVNNTGLATLAPVGGLGYRAFNFTKDSWPVALPDLVSAFRYVTVKERFAQSGLPDAIREKLPYYHDGFDLWDIFERYVTKFLDIFYTDEAAIVGDAEIQAYWGDFDHQVPNGLYNVGALNKANLVKQLTYSIYTVTAAHQYIGGVTEYIVQPFGVANAVAVNAISATVQCSIYAQNLMAATALKMPDLLNDWSHLYASIRDTNAGQYGQVTSLLTQWQAELREFSAVVEERNKVRQASGRQPFNALNPKLFDCSVSV